MKNVDPHVVEDFGREWSRFDQRDMPDAERQQRFEEYFAVFPWDGLPAGAEGFDAGCGSGRWALLVAPRVGVLHCIDPSEAIEVARASAAHLSNCRFHRATIDEMPMADASMDFGYSLGVLHHLPDTAVGLADCVRKLKPGAPFLVYLYYAFDNRPAWFRGLWTLSDLMRRAVCRLSPRPKRVVSDMVALAVYWPLARMAALLERAGCAVDAFPLSFYRDKSFYSMRTDALDRFGTRLEHRFTRTQIAAMMEQAGLERVRFSERAPYWCACGVRRR